MFYVMNSPKTDDYKSCSFIGGIFLKTLEKTIVAVSITFGLFGSALPGITSTDVAQAKVTKVWIAPNHGKRYHYDKHCPGLRFAKSLSHVSLKWAKAHHYTKCAKEY